MRNAAIFAFCLIVTVPFRGRAGEGSQAEDQGIAWGDTKFHDILWRCMAYNYPKKVPRCAENCWANLPEDGKDERLDAHAPACEGKYKGDTAAYVNKKVGMFIRQNWKDGSGKHLDRWSAWDLALLIKAAAEGTAKYYAETPDAVADKNRCGDSWTGTTTNLVNGVFRERGCQETQRIVFDAVLMGAGIDTARARLEVKKLVIGKVMEHHVVIVYPKDADWAQTGVVLDPWIRQCPDPDVFAMTYPDWLAGLELQGLIKSSRLEPNY